jgi:GxxExxY protein
VRERGIPFARETKVPLSFEGQDIGYSADMPLLVYGHIPVFCLSVATVAPIHERRLLARLRQAHLSRGYILNFNAPTLANGIRRVSLS